MVAAAAEEGEEEAEGVFFCPNESQFGLTLKTAMSGSGGPFLLPTQQISLSETDPKSDHLPTCAERVLEDAKKGPNSKRSLSESDRVFFGFQRSQVECTCGCPKNTFCETSHVSQIGCFRCSETQDGLSVQNKMLWGSQKVFLGQSAKGAYLSQIGCLGCPLSGLRFSLSLENTAQEQHQRFRR